MSAAPGTFAIGTFSAEGEPPFPAVVARQDVLPLTAVGDEFADCWSVLSLLEKWDTAFPAIRDKSVPFRQTSGAGLPA